MNLKLMIFFLVSSITLIALGVFGFFAMGTSKARLPKFDGPILECPQLVELGPMEHGAVADGCFSIKNIGNRQLVISHLRATCACESVEVKRANGFVQANEILLAPNETADMRLRIAVDGKTNASLRSAVYFQTNDPNALQTSVVISIPKVFGGVTSIPSSVQFNSVPISSVSRQTVEVFDPRAEPRKISLIQSTNPDRITAKMVHNASQSLNPTNQGTLIATIEISVDTSYPGPIVGDVLLHVLDGSVKPDQIRVTGQVIAPIEISPSVLTLPRSSSSGPLYNGKCVLRSDSKEMFDLKILKVPDGFTVTFPALSNEAIGTREISIELNQKDLEQNLSDYVQIIQIEAKLGDRRHLVQVPVRIQSMKNRVMQ